MYDFYNDIRGEKDGFVGFAGLILGLTSEEVLNAMGLLVYLPHSI